MEEGTLFPVKGGKPEWEFPFLPKSDPEVSPNKIGGKVTLPLSFPVERWVVTFLQLATKYDGGQGRVAT